MEHEKLRTANTEKKVKTVWNHCPLAFLTIPILSDCDDNYRPHAPKHIPLKALRAGLQEISPQAIEQEALHRPRLWGLVFPWF